MYNEAEKLDVDTTKFIESMIGREGQLYKECPHCKNEKIIKFGKFKGIQRYRCKSCGKTFSNVTNTPFCRSKKPLAYWLVYSKLMFSGRTIRECSAMLKINIATAFYWRHKILDSLFFLEGKEVLEGEIQLRDVYFQESFKGQKGKKIAKRPNPLTRRLRMEECVGVICIIDSNNKVMIDPLCKNIFRRSGIKEWFNKRIELAPRAKFISSVAKFNNKWTMEIFGNRIKKGNAEETRVGRDLGRTLELWIGEKFRGVATKYLNNYLVWFKYFISGSLNSYRELFSKKLNMLINSQENVFLVNRIKDYKEKKIVLYGD